jgi:hypothetical protein
MSTYTLRSSKLLASWSGKLTPRTTQLDQSLLSAAPWKPRLGISNGQRQLHTEAPNLNGHGSAHRHLPQSLCLNVVRKQTLVPGGTIARQVRFLSSKSKLNEARSPVSPVVREEKSIRTEPDEDDDEAEFQKTDKASRASQVNLSAKLSKEGAAQGAGFGEVWRLIKIARPEAKVLGLPSCFY